MEQRNSYRNDKGKAQSGEQPERLNTDVLYEGRLSRSSKEAPVMGVERRAEVIQLKLPLSTLSDRGRNGTMETKSIPITQEMVIASYKRVRSNKGAAGIDGESLEKFEEKLSKNLYKIWNRLSSGSYHPTDVLEVEIPKDDGRKRKLGIPTVSDRIAQQVVKDYLEARFEKEFSEHSYGYRPLKSAHQAVAQVRRNVREYGWVIDMDISSFFDKVSHELLMKAIDRHVSEEWVKMYIKRWLNTSIEDRKGNKREREGEGTPQGGVISPLLANLFLHYAFDKWLGKLYPHLRFVRYADDIIVHCRTQEEAERVLAAIRERMSNCKLQLNEKKTKIVYCKKARRNAKYGVVKFDFLGFSFQPRTILNKQENILFLGFECAISQKSEKKIVEIIRKTEFHRWTNSDIYRISTYFNPKIEGWINYFGKFGKRKLQKIFYIFHQRLNKWVIRRYKRFNGCHREAGIWLRALAKRQPSLFIHWQHGFQSA
jgi:group II intron reverse transcriptase/maturase